MKNSFSRRRLRFSFAVALANLSISSSLFCLLLAWLWPGSADAVGASHERWLCFSFLSFGFWRCFVYITENQQIANAFFFPSPFLVGFHFWCCPPSAGRACGAASPSVAVRIVRRRDILIIHFDFWSANCFKPKHAEARTGLWALLGNRWAGHSSMCWAGRWESARVATNRAACDL